ncbi:MAG: shikimate dehydrogenase [Casimicrobiaceae bacterium]
MAAPGHPPTTAKFLVGLIGEGIQGSRSPALHEQEARELGLTLHYQLIDPARIERAVTGLPQLLDAAQAIGFAGLNITHPFKQAVLPMLDRLSPDAEAIGAVNTVVFRDGRCSGHNTDWSGFAAPFRRDLADVARDHVVLLGAGGAGSAVAHALLSLGTQQLSIVDPDVSKAEALARGLSARFAGRLVQLARDGCAAIAAADGLINATPIGMTGHPGIAIDPACLTRRHWVADVVYVPLQTELLRAAEQRGCRTLDGGGMAVWQAVGAFELFTGRAPDARRMERHFRSIVS